MNLPATEDKKTAVVNIRLVLKFHNATTDCCRAGDS